MKQVLTSLGLPLAQATIVCRANAESEAVLRIDGHEMTSPEGALHRWVVGGLKPGRSYPYTVTPGRGKPRGGTLRTLPADGAVTIGLAGDPQSGAPWRDVAASIHTARPDLLVILGDLVADGLAEEAWTRLFFDPAADLLAQVPCVAVSGNHDRRSPVLDRMFLEPLGGANWVQEVGAALLVGLDGGLDWSPPGANARWLDQTLAASRKPFIFVMTHYPAYSSHNHGKLAADGRVLERCSRVARTQIVPLLEKHQVTAVFAGHDHGYERSELPSGLSMIVTAGAGAGVYGKVADAEKQNPHSKAFVPKHHHCQVRVESAAAVFTAVTADGQIIDTRTFHPRARQESHP